MPVPCSRSNSYIVLEKEGRFTCNHTHRVVSHKPIPRNMLQEDQPHSMNVQLWLLSPSFTTEAHLKQNILKGSTNLKQDTLPNLVLLSFLVYLKAACWMFLESRCANTYRKPKSCTLALSLNFITNIQNYTKVFLCAAPHCIISSWNT